MRISQKQRQGKRSHVFQARLKGMQNNRFRYKKTIIKIILLINHAIFRQYFAYICSEFNKITKPPTLTS